MVEILSGPHRRGGPCKNISQACVYTIYYRLLGTVPFNLGLFLRRAIGRSKHDHFAVEIFSF